MAGVIEKKKQPVRAVFGVSWQIAKLLFIPHRGNNYKPHIIRNYGIIFVVMTVIGLQFGYNAINNSNILGDRTEITINSLLDKTNLERQKNGLGQLTLNEKLDQAAYLKAEDMFADQYWAHDAPDGTQPWKWLGDVKYDYNKAGENLAKNFASTDTAVAAWMASPEHRANILDPEYSEVGFALVSGNLNGSPTSIIVALYGSPASSAVLAGTNFYEANYPGGINIFQQFAIAVRSLTPVLLVGLGLITLSIFVAVAAHTKRHKLPKALAKSWRRHHGLYKSIGLAAFGLAIIFISGAGQI